MPLTEDDEARRAYMGAAVDQLKTAIADRNGLAAVEVIKKMHADGYRWEARTLVTFLAGVAAEAAAAEAAETAERRRRERRNRVVGRTRATGSEPGE